MAHAKVHSGKIDTRNAEPIEVKTPKTDRELMTQFAKKQDKSAYEELVNRWDQRVLGFLTKATGDYETAKDLRQDVFIRVYRYGRTYNDEFAFTTWLFRIVRNVLSTWRNKKNRYLELVNAAADRNKIVDFPATPRSSAETGETVRTVREAIAQLAPSERELLLLRFETELSYREIAAVQDAPETTVKSRVYKLLAQLRCSFEGAMHEHAEG